LGRLKEVSGIINYVYWLGKPAVVKNTEIEIIKQFLHDHNNVHIEMPSIAIDDPVKISSGPLMDKHGIIVVVKSNTVKVALASLGCIMYAEIDRSNIELVPRDCYMEKRRALQY
jgi:transcription termination/antitermination protein NusG